jgi:hypothetical protein
MNIFFPTRLIDTSDESDDVNWLMDHAVRKYVDQCVCILIYEASLKDPIKVVEFAKPFEDLNAPDPRD